MHDMMRGMGLVGLLDVAVIILVIAALVKYVFFRREHYCAQNSASHPTAR